MKKSCITLAAVMVALSCMQVSVKLVVAQSLGEAVTQDKAMIQIHGNLRSRSEGLVVLDVLVKNTGMSPAYLVTDTRRVDRSEGPYIDTDNANPSMLICSFQFYPPNPFNPFVDGTSAHLIRLESGESHEDLIRLSWPLRTTEPPFSSAPGTRAVPTKTIKWIEARFGVLPASASLTELVKRKILPHDSFTGMERIEAGPTKKSLYEIQEIARSNAVAVSE